MGRRAAGGAGADALTGVRTAPLAVFEAAGRPLPRAGDRHPDGTETVHCFVVALGAVGEDVAGDEDGGHRCLADWRAARELAWRAADPQLGVDDDLPVVVERYRPAP